ncbi:MAG: hypothetical protein GXP24_08825 [Planctomycetes bacterium]|nr:hypothetical protein [Planctomycetota bacterium]
MLRCNKIKDRKLSMQELEKRELMAGDVAVSLSNGVLNIEGDDAGNYVQVDQLSDGAYKVSGRYSNGRSTLINGRYNDLIFKGVENINVQMADGQDQLNLNGTGIPTDLLKGDLNIQMGYGDDVVRVNKFWVAGDAQIDTDEVDNSWNAKNQGDDLLTAKDFVVIGSLDVTTSEGADQVLFVASSNNWNAFYEGFSLNTGTGTKAGDIVDLQNVFTWKGIDINTSNGDDTFNGKAMMAYEGNININTYDGNDNVTLLDSNMNWQLTDYDTSVRINTGGDNDRVTLKNVDVRGSVLVETSSGNDKVEMDDVNAKEYLYASLGSGNDDLTVKSSSAGRALFYGGSNFSGGDGLTEDDNDFGSRYASGWEWM